MARLGDVRRAVRDRLISMVPTDVKVYAFITDAASVPCLWIEPSRRFMKPTTDFGGGCEYFLILTIVVNRMDEESAQDALDDYLDPAGPFVAGLEGTSGTEPLDDLKVLVDFTEVISGDSYGTYKVGDTYYFGAQLSIKVMASN